MGVCDVPVIATVCQTAGQGAASLVAAPFDWLAQAMGQAAKWLIQTMWSVFDATTLVDVTAPGYVHVYNVLFGVAVFIMLIFFCLQLLTGLSHRDPTALTHAALGLAKSVLGSFVILTLTGLLLTITDQLATGIVQATGTTMAGIGDRITLLAAGLTTITIAAPGVGAIVTIFLAGLAISAAVIVWFSLLIRKALLLVAVVLGPVALAGATWQATRGWVSKWVSFVIALICSKVVLVVIFLVAAAQTAAPIDAGLASISQPISGIVLFLLAAFAPYLTYKFISFAGFDLYHAMSSEQEAKQALNRPVPIPTSPQAHTIQRILDGTVGTGSRGGTTADSGASADTATRAAGTGTTATASSGGSGGTAGGANAATGAGPSTGASAGAGAGAAAGPVGIAAVAGAAVVKQAATAGPTLGGTVAATADHTTPPPPSPRVPAPATPPAPAPQPTPPPAPPATPGPTGKE